MEDLILSFSTTNHAILGENLLLAQNISVRVMPLPGAIRAGCGLCLRLSPEDVTAGLKALAQGAVPVEGLYQKGLEEGRPIYQLQELLET